MALLLGLERQSRVAAVAAQHPGALCLTAVCLLVVAVTASILAGQEGASVVAVGAAVCSALVASAASSSSGLPANRGLYAI